MSFKSQSRQLKDSSKKVSCYAAFTSNQMKVLNAETPKGQPHQKVNQLLKMIAEKWGKMTEEERVAATEEDLVALTIIMNANREAVVMAGCPCKKCSNARDGHE
ncbi:hypothetical protein BT96DRAFT_987077 [Gymnopus androsaceus JB14]|uniref:HMG box domain-containing protein n=1 Tax=Gymnopus androsaceus JB14 TaxID=1447944 RepID=A0A6A4IBZ3_9AGAR|nr:hypothetical protein BT96DRAFT_987077 [Gymnopus androsaceus JB14]